MNHQPFRDWLLSSEELSADEAQSLNEHLAECESCNKINIAWADVQQLIESSPQVDASPGFTQRWQARLAEYEKRKKLRQGWTSIAITALVAIALISILAYQVWQLLQEPGPIIAAWLNQLVSLVSNYYILQALFTNSAWLKPVNILVGSFFLIGMICFISVSWMSVYQKIIIARRIE